MLTLSDARAFVNNSAYFARGRVYAEEGCVRGLQRFHRQDGSVVLSASVLTGEQRYEVGVCYTAQRLISCDCGCAMFERSGVMCKHVAAVLIAAADGETPAAPRNPEESAKREAARLDAERREQEAQQEKDLFLDTLLHMNEKKRRDAIRLRHEAVGDVRLFPVLVYEDGACGLEIKIGKTRAYVVRSLAQFAQCAQNGGMETYGKELTFSHTEEELHPQDVEFYRAVVRLGLGAENRAGRLPLTGNALDEIMRLLLGREVELRIAGGETQMARVVEGDVSVQGQLTQKGNNHLLTLNAPDMVYGARGAYGFFPAEGEIRCALGRAFSPLQPLFEMMTRYPNGIELDAQQLSGVATRLLVPAGAMLNMTKGREILLERTPMAMKPRFLVDMEGRERLTCEVLYDYGAAVLSARQDNPHIRRDTLAEEEAALCAKRLFPKAGTDGVYAFEGKTDAVFELLSEKLPELRKDGEVLIAERLKAMNVETRRAITFGLTKNGTQLTVKADLGGLSQQELEAAYFAYRQKKKFIVLEDGAFLSGEALRQAAEAAEVAKGLDLTAEELAAGANVPLNRAMYLDAALKEREEMALAAPGELEDFVKRLNASRDVSAEPPKTLKATLRPYQLTGYNWLCALHDAGFGGILADDMGLGKTLQAIALLLREKEAGKPLRALVVCPASLQLNWLSEAEKFAPGLRCEAMIGAAQKRMELLAREDVDVFIVSYDQLRRDAQSYFGQKFTHVLLDEAQNIKNAASQNAKAVKALDCGYRLAMTGTPIENRLSELWSIFDFLMPGYLLSYKKFKERFEAPIVQDKDEEAQKNLKMLVAPFILRRMKKDVLTDLPEKVETVVRSEMTAEQRKLYAAYAAKLAGELDAGIGGAKQRMDILSGLTRLRQICCDPALCFEAYAGGSGKMEQCMELVRNAVQAGHEILLFSQFTTMLDALKTRIEDEGISAFLLTGDTDKEERMDLVRRFNAGEADVFLISLKAGGTGLNLTGADVVIHYDPWWNTAAQNQATDRAYRIGQTRGVQVIKLIASGSVEEQILKLQEEKSELAGGVLTEGEALAALDETTMRKLLL